MWIAHKDGLDMRMHNGAQITGFNLAAQNEPVIFDARRFLHASQEWPADTTRVVLIAWTVIHVRTMPMHLVVELQKAGFPVPSEADLSVEVPSDWVPGTSMPKTKKLKQSPLVFAPSSGWTPGLSVEGGIVTHHLD